MSNGKRSRRPVEQEEDDEENILSRDQANDLFGVASATRSRGQTGQGQSTARSLAVNSGAVAVAGVGSSRDSGRANAAAAAEAARAQLQRNEELKTLVGQYIDSFHGIGSVHARALLSDEHALIILVARHFKWREMDGTIESSLPTHGKFKARTMQPVAELVGVVCALLASMVPAAREGCVANMQDVLSDKDRRQADNGRMPGSALGATAIVPSVTAGIKMYKAVYVGHYADEGRVARLSGADGGDGARREASGERIETIHGEVTVAQGNTKQGELELRHREWVKLTGAEADAGRHWGIDELGTTMCLEEFKAFIQSAWLGFGTPLMAFVRTPRVTRGAETLHHKLSVPGVTVADAKKFRDEHGESDVVKGFACLEDFSLVMRSIFFLLDRVYSFSGEVRKGVKRLLVAVTSTVVSASQGEAARQYDEEDRAVFHILHLNFAQLAWRSFDKALKKVKVINSDSVVALVDDLIAEHLLEKDSLTHAPSMMITQAFNARHGSDTLAKLNTAGMLERMIEGASRSLLSESGKQKETVRVATRVPAVTPRAERHQICYHSLYDKDKAEVCVDKACPYMHLNYYAGVNGDPWNNMVSEWSKIKDLPFRKDVKDDFDARARGHRFDKGNRGAKKRRT